MKKAIILLLALSVFFASCQDLGGNSESQASSNAESSLFEQSEQSEQSQQTEALVKVETAAPGTVEPNGVAVPLNEEEQKQVMELIGSAEKDDNIGKCGYEFTVETKDKKYNYCSKCRTLIYSDNSESFKLSVEANNRLKSMLFIKLENPNPLTAASKLKLEGEVTKIEFSVLPEAYDRTFESPSVIQDCLENILETELNSDFDENPNEYSGVSVIAKLSFDNGSETELCFLDKWLSINGTWYECKPEQLVWIDELLFRAVDYKPVIYLYPETETRVSVKLDYAGELTCTYPEYNGGWKVTARPDGSLTDSKGMEYNYLFWEGISGTEWDMSRGFCVKGEDTAAFLEQALADLGLTRREANEFIVFWLPKMQENKYNLISFQTGLYEETAKLEITPKPDTLIRVFMVYQPLEDYVEVPAQQLQAPERIGFTAVEWGGSELNDRFVK